jgi:hypothetical protein
VIENDFLKAEFNKKTGMLSSLKGKGPVKVSTDLYEDFLVYNDRTGMFFQKTACFSFILKVLIVSHFRRSISVSS